MTTVQFDSHVTVALKPKDGAEFRLDDAFLSQFRGKQPQWGPLGYVTFKRTYARDIPKHFYSKGDYEKIAVAFTETFHTPFSLDDADKIIDLLEPTSEELYFSASKWNAILPDLRNIPCVAHAEELHPIAINEWTHIRKKVNAIGRAERTEEFWETVKRVVEGVFTMQKERCLTKNLAWDEKEGLKHAHKMYEKIWNFKFLPPGRGLFTMGTKFVKERGTTALNNCAFISTNNIVEDGSKIFCWAMDALMLGVGVGSDTRGANLLTVKKPTPLTKPFVIPDSREGWVDALRVLLNAYFDDDGALPSFDYSAIREAGEPIRGFGGVASGPDPLRQMLDAIKIILEENIGKNLTSVDITDIFNNIGRCVVAGNVRRSAEIILGEETDTAWVNIKNTPSDKLPPHRQARWASNNSILAKVGMDYTAIAKRIVDGGKGEPGLIWLENAQHYSRMIDPIDDKDESALGCNPCSEQTLESFEMCCLVESFPANHDNYEEYEETLKYAYVYAKTVTLGYIKDKRWTETNSVMTGNRRLGISQTGIVDAFAKHGRRTMLQWCDNGYKFLRKLDKEYSKKWLRVRESIKLTTVKPSGTVSLLPGASAGIHYPHSEFYIRRIRMAAEFALVKPLEEAGYHVYDDPDQVIYATDASGKIIMENDKPKVLRYTTKIVDFPVHEKHYLRGKKDVTVWEQIANAVDYQKWWSDNQVSITVTYKPEEAKDLATILSIYDTQLKGISFMPESTKKYKNPPYEEIPKEKYEELVKGIKSLDFSKIYIQAEGEGGCTNEGCQQKKELEALKPVQ